MALKQTSSATFAQDTAGLNVVVWTGYNCAPCNQLIANLEVMGLDVPVLTIDMNANFDLYQQQGVQGIPTVMIVKDGKVVDMNTGVLSKDHIEFMLAPHRS